jgi:DNA mismatch repair protein MutS2
MTHAQLQVGDSVSVIHLKQSGVIMRVVSRGRYQVAIGSLTVICREEELTLSADKSPRSATKRKAPYALTKKIRVSTTIDLHGCTVSDAEHRLEQWLNTLIVNGAKQAKVIHGLGTGAVQNATHKLLTRYDAVRGFKVNPANPGETDIYLV